ncbi:hypothetical protein VKT23_018999 [Stygiomarasmius scandens]|uniref:DUF6593 domain-containing protein n=1 Tax=Marasmiellus scandens TaxID=2682957 RepID=A0ABR1IMN1_9AGAR
MNPYNVWGTEASQGDGRPSVYGALPFTGATQEPALLAFTFASNTSDIFNSVVVGPGNSSQYWVTTDSRYTMLKTQDGKGVALIEWSQPPKVEVRGTVMKQPASSFLRLSQDGNRSHRIMLFGNQQLSWIAQNSSISLFAIRGAGSAELLARISKSGRAINLEIAQSAAQAGLLPVCLVATILLQSGRSID